MTYGSLINHLDAAGVIGQPTPVVGMGATILHWSDREAATIVSVEKYRGRVLLGVQRDRAERVDNNGMSECQSYIYHRETSGGVVYYLQAKNGRWQQVWKNPNTGRWNVHPGAGLKIGERDQYYDYSF